MSECDPSSSGSPPPEPPFQFSLGMLLIAVTLVAVCCGLVAWLGLEMTAVPLLLVGPLGGEIGRRVTGSGREWDMVGWSGMVTATVWGVLMCGECLLKMCLEPSGFVLGLYALAFAIYVPFGFFVGMVTGLVWKVCVGGLGFVRRRIGGREVSESSRDGGE